MKEWEKVQSSKTTFPVVVDYIEYVDKDKQKKRGKGESERNRNKKRKRKKEWEKEVHCRRQLSL